MLNSLNCKEIWQKFDSRHPTLCKGGKGWRDVIKQINTNEHCYQDNSNTGIAVSMEKEERISNVLARIVALWMVKNAFATKSNKSEQTCYSHGQSDSRPKLLDVDLVPNFLHACMPQVAKILSKYAHVIVTFVPTPLPHRSLATISFQKSFLHMRLCTGNQFSKWKWSLFNIRHSLVKS